MNTKPLISVVIPVYNSAKTLVQCVESVLRQTYTYYEIILVDDGSRDDSPAVCDRLAAQHECVCVIHQANGGVSSARNVGMAKATGEYLFFLDGDDFLDEKTLETYVFATDHGRVDAIVGGLTVVENGTVTKQDGPKETRVFEEDLWEHMAKDPRAFGYAGGKMIRTSIVREYALLFDSRMASQEDLDFFLSVYPHCKSVCALAFYGYRYMYVPSKRKPVIGDFIANQTKLYNKACEKTTLSVEAAQSVALRVVQLIYSGLYEAAKEKQVEKEAQTYVVSEEMMTCIQSISLHGERAMVMAWFFKTKFRRIERFFRFRQRVMRLLRRG